MQKDVSCQPLLKQVTVTVTEMQNIFKIIKSEVNSNYNSKL